LHNQLAKDGRHGESWMKWSLGMEIGCNGLGWWAYGIDKKGDIVASLDGGVRLFPDGREPSSPGHIGDSKALIRRRARRARRNRERRKLRIRALVRNIMSASM
jgi:CRISPR-associated endonuclease Csn1